MLNPETSLSKLSSHDWMICQNRWTRGIDWVVEKVGKKWTPLECFGKGWPLYKTKTEAYDRVTDLILMEARHREEITNL